MRSFLALIICNHFTKVHIIAHSFTTFPNI
nr:MAG TPA: hypothetical protein [Caudoviricetes sp.]